MPGAQLLARLLLLQGGRGARAARRQAAVRSAGVRAEARVGGRARVGRGSQVRQRGVLGLQARNARAGVGRRGLRGGRTAGRGGGRGCGGLELGAQGGRTLLRRAMRRGKRRLCLRPPRQMLLQRLSAHGVPLAVHMWKAPAQHACCAPAPETSKGTALCASGCGCGLRA